MRLGGANIGFICILKYLLVPQLAKIAYLTGDALYTDCIGSKWLASLQEHAYQEASQTDQQS